MFSKNILKKFLLNYCLLAMVRNVLVSEQLCRDLGVCNEVRFLGKQEAIKKFYRLAIFLLSPSETRTFGLAALEAMACRVPVISTNAGGMPELRMLNGYTIKIMWAM